MPQAARSRSRALVVFLLLALFALPAFAGEQERAQAPRERGFLVSLWQALAGLVPAIVDLGPGLDPLGGDQEPNGSQGDLGPELDPLG
jgi:hypothetical protein